MKIKAVITNPIIKLDVHTHTIFYPGLCGHFALGTVSQTCLDESVSVANKSKIASELDVSLSQLTHSVIPFFNYS